MKRTLLVMMLALPLFSLSMAAEDPLDFYIENAKPVAEHKTLAELAGSWKVTTSWWFDPSGKPQIANGEGTGRAILGGRFITLDTNVRGDVASQALTIFGFDRRTGEFTLVGYDDLGTFYITAAGKRDDAQKAIVLDGSYLQPPANTEQKYRWVWTRPNSNEHLLTLYFDMNGKQVRVAETRMVRR